MVTLDTLGPKECLPGPRLPTATPSSQWTPKLREGWRSAQGRTLSPVSQHRVSRDPALLTSAQAEACAPQLAAGQGPVVPEGKLSTGLVQVSRPEAIVNHRMVEHRAEAASYHPCPLAAGVAVIRQHGTMGQVGWPSSGYPLTLPSTNQSPDATILPHNVRALWLPPTS